MGKQKRGAVGRREFVAGALAGGLIAKAANSTLAAPAERPNVLFILADDLGWGDLSCYGRPDYRTPNLDRLAQRDVRFTHAYSASPVCTPTRCAFITGRYPARAAVGLEEPALFWRTRRQDAARVGKWKYPREGKDEYLFDLSVDEREQADSKGENPDMFQRLRAEFQRWQSQVLPYPKSGDGTGA